MPSSYSTNLKIELQATGENSGTWGNITNTNLGTALEQAIVGYGNPSYPSDANLTLTYTDTNAAQAARALVLNVTSAVSLSATRELVVPTIQKQYIVQNNTSGSQSITVKTSAGTGITVPNGRKAHLYVDGTNVIYMDDYVDINGGAIDGTPIGANSASTGAFTTLSASGNITVSGGTANGVLYLNGSKVATSGSALTFDGTLLSVGGGTNGTRFAVKGSAAFGGFDTGAATDGRIEYAYNGTNIFYTSMDSSSLMTLMARSGVSLAFGANGSEGMRLTSTGLGIGTSSPANKLQVVASTSGTNDLVTISRFDRATSGTAANGLGGRLEFSAQDNAGSQRTAAFINWGLASVASGSPTGFLSLSTRGTDPALYIDNSGNLGIGTSSPATKLNLGGSSDQSIQINGSGTAAYVGTSTAVAQISSNRNPTTGAIYDANRAVSYINLEASNGNGNIQFYTTATNNVNATERMRLDASGNLGLGVTPSAWGSPYRAVQLSGGALANYSTAAIELYQNAYDSGDGAYKYINSNFATVYSQVVGEHRWANAASGTAGNAITWTRRMTLDASGNLGLGSTSIANYRMYIESAGATSGTHAMLMRNSSLTTLFSVRSDGTIVGGNNAMTLDASGNLSLGTTTSGGLLTLKNANPAVSLISVQSYANTNEIGDISFDQTTDLFTFSHKLSSGGITFETNATERARISAGGYWKASNAGTYVGSTADYHELRTDKQSDSCVVITTSNTSYDKNTDGLISASVARSASSSYTIAGWYSGDYTDREFQFRGDGNGYADGTWNNNGADYAEYFESATGGALTVGATVVLDGNKVREATASDPVSEIMGVVRPKEPSKASMVVGNTAWNKWANKYLTDDFDRYIMEDHDVVEWTDEDGKQHSYESHNIPDGVTVPADAVRKTHDEKGNKFQHYKLNPAWDKDAEYTPREKRDEWVIIGLVGQVKVLKGKPVNDRWIKMRDVSAAVEEWMIR